MDKDTDKRLAEAESKLAALKTELDDIKRLVGDVKKEVFEAAMLLSDLDNANVRAFELKWQSF